MRCGLTNLEKRRTRGDLIEAYKIMTGKETISAHKFFEVSMENRTRGQGYTSFIKNELGSGGIDFSVRGLWIRGRIWMRRHGATVDNFKRKGQEYNRNM